MSVFYFFIVVPIGKVGADVVFVEIVDTVSVKDMAGTAGFEPEREEIKAS